MIYIRVGLILAAPAIGCDRVADEGRRPQLKAAVEKDKRGSASVDTPLNPAVASATARDPRCAEFLNDATFLEDVFEAVSESSYKPTKKSCASWRRRLDERFPEDQGTWFSTSGDERTPGEAAPPDWKKQHKISNMSEPDEPKATTAARTLFMTCVPITRDFACGFEADLVKEFGMETLAVDFGRDFHRFVGELRAACE